MIYFFYLSSVINKFNSLIKNFDYFVEHLLPVFLFLILILFFVFILHLFLTYFEFLEKTERKDPPLIILPFIPLAEVIIFLIFRGKLRNFLLIRVPLLYFSFFIIYYFIYYLIRILKTKTCSICGKKVKYQKIKKIVTSSKDARSLSSKRVNFFLVYPNGKAICSQCYASLPKCVHCDDVIFGKSYLTDKNRKLCKKCFQLYKAGSNVCHICGIPIENDYYTLISLGKKICKECIKKFPLCDCCNKPIVGESFVKDFRFICADCYRNIVIYEDKLPQMAAEVKNIMKKVLNMEIKHDIEIKMLSAKEMKDKRGTVNWGYFYRYGDTFQIKILRYLTKANIYKVLAHELAHAWQAENCPKNCKKRFLEGFAEWVAYKVLISLGEVQEAERMETRMWGDYLEGFKKFKKIEEKYGISKIFQLVKSYTDFPF